MTEPKTIYVITKGIYSDYHICAVATDKTRAEELRLFFSDQYEEANIEEYEDGKTGLENESFKVVHPYIVSGCRRNLKKYGDLIHDARQYTKILDNRTSFKETVSYGISGEPSDWLDMYIIAPDVEHAKKIWYDTWAKLNAEALDL